ncbi:hypothetical protein DYH09_07675 [bacterium CPR1]|nr:hypothetical protein [bacterium CPR1]
MAELVLAFGIVAVAILGLVGVFLGGVQLSARSRDLATGTELAHQVLEQVKYNIKKGGFAYIPNGAYTFDGRNPDPTVGVAPLLFPPGPYPGQTLSSQKFDIIVTGQELSPTLRSISVQARWGRPSSDPVAAGGPGHHRTPEPRDRAQRLRQRRA